MSWLVLLGLAVGTLAFKAVGALVLARHTLPRRVQRAVRALPLVVYPALAASETFGSDAGGLHIDARLVAVLVVGVVLVVSRGRNLFGPVMLLGAAVAALVRLVWH
jgi:branched-subunit amino acid transport protein